MIIVMNLMYCGDRNVKKGIFLSLSSIIKRTKRSLNVYILTASIDNHIKIENDFKEFIENYIKKVNSESVVYLIDLSCEFESYLPLANMDTRFTPLCMLRLFSDKVTEIPDKILYLDTDVMCLRDLSSLYETDISDCEICGVADRYGKWFFGNILTHNYLNSGVLLMNMKRIRESSLFEKCRKMCQEKKMLMPDQSALNKLAKKKKVSRKYNEQWRIRKSTVLKHFTTFFEFRPFFKAITIKPWDIDKVHRKLKIYAFDVELNEYIKRKEIIEGEQI